MSLKARVFQCFGCFFNDVVYMVIQYDTDFCPSGLSHPPFEVKFACKSSMIMQVVGAEHLPDTQHVALSYLLEGPGILVILLHISLLLLQGS